MNEVYELGFIDFLPFFFYDCSISEKNPYSNTSLFIFQSLAIIIFFSQY